MTFRVNDVARRVALAAVAALPSKSSASESPLCGMGWSLMHQRGQEPECGVSVRVLMPSGQEVRVSVDVLPAPSAALPRSGPRMTSATRRADLYGRRKR